MVKANVANPVVENICEVHSVLILLFGKGYSLSSVTEERNTLLVCWGFFKPSEIWQENVEMCILGTS